MPHVCAISQNEVIFLNLSVWKASLLSIAGRVQLVKSVIQSMLIYNISIGYSQHKLVTIDWKKVCAPLDEDGLVLVWGLWQVSMKLQIWNSAFWGRLGSLLSSRVFRGDKFVNYHIYYSLWTTSKLRCQ
jgi:hypothetical protein